MRVLLICFNLPLCLGLLIPALPGCLESGEGEGCRCALNGTQLETPWKVQCCCVGNRVTTVPHNLTIEVETLILRGVSMQRIDQNNFQMYSKLTTIDIDSAPNLAFIDASAFTPLQHLKKLSIKNCKELKEIKGSLLEHNPKLWTITIQDTGLTRIPLLKMHKIDASQNPPEIKLSHNEIETVEEGDVVNLSAAFVDLSHNRIRRVGAKSFQYSNIKKLILADNPLRTLDEIAFENSVMSYLDLSRTQLEKIPGTGLYKLETLRIEGTESLKKMPSPLAFGHLKAAYLTYPHHCCFFKHVDLSAKSPLHLKETKNVEDLKRDHCKLRQSPGGAAGTEQTGIPLRLNHPPRIKKSVWGNFVKETVKPNNSSRKSVPTPTALKGIFGAVVDKKEEDSGEFFDEYDLGEEVVLMDEGSVMFGPGKQRWETGPINVSTINISPTVCEGGDYEEVYKYFRDIVCTPEITPLNPCEGVMGYDVLSVLVWFVWFLAIAGNLLVLVVLWLTHHPRMRVHYFLMMNLAFADLCVGIYLAMLAIEDVRTAGQYYNFAIDWQTGVWCQLAGFISVFASELSIVTMFLISFDNWYNTKYIFFGRRLEMKAAVPAMALGWCFAFTMAALPLAGVSSYTVTSTCLPLRVEYTGDKVYIVFGLLVNILAFIAISAGYISIYVQVGGSASPGTRSEDARIAKKMFILIFTDFICWAPTIFFGLTGAAKIPLISISVAKIFLVVFYPINAMANPFLYVFFTKMFRKDMSRVARKHIWMQKLKPTNLRSSANSRNQFIARYYSSNPQSQPQTGTCNGTDMTTCNISRTSTPRGSSASIKRGSGQSLKLSYEGRGQHLDVPTEHLSHRRMGSTGRGSDPEKPSEGLIPLLRRKSITLQLRPRFTPQMSDISENSHSHSHSSQSNDELNEGTKSPKRDHTYTTHQLRPVVEERRTSISKAEDGQEESDWMRRSSSGSWRTSSSVVGSEIGNSRSKLSGSVESGQCLVEIAPNPWKLRRESGQSAESGYYTSVAGTPDIAARQFELPLIKKSESKVTEIYNQQRSSWL